MNIGQYEVTVENLAREYDMQPEELRAFADDLLDDLHDGDVIPLDVADFIIDALNQEV